MYLLWIVLIIPYITSVHQGTTLIKEAWQRKRNISNAMLESHNRLLEISTKEEVLRFEELEVKKLDWEVHNHKNSGENGRHDDVRD